MPPICDPRGRDSSEEKTPAQIPACPCCPPDVRAVLDEDCADLCEPTGPFYGMFDGHDEEEDDDNSGWLQAPGSSSPGRGSGSSIPEASETFQRVMRQLDDRQQAEVPCGPGGQQHPPPPQEKGTKSGKLERKSSKVKKSASFSSASSAAGARSSSSSSSTASSSCSSHPSSRRPEPDAKRRMSVPCVPGPKRVHWADEAGVSELVSVRLIKPRLARSCDREEAQATPAPSRSILRRLSGMR